MKKKKSSIILKKLPKNKRKVALKEELFEDNPPENETLPVANQKKNKKTQLEPVEVIKKIKPKDKEHYVNGKEFEEEIRQFYGTGNISIKLGESITKIANGLSYAPNFINYSYKDDMVGDAIVKMFSALKNKKFRLDSGFSPFSYFTTIAFHAFINRIKKEKKHHEALTQYREKVYMELMLDPDENNGAHIYVDMSTYSEDDN